MTPDASFDGGSLDCGSGLLLLIRRHIDPLEPGQLLEVRSTESSVEEDLPAWARLTAEQLGRLLQRAHVGALGERDPHEVAALGLDETGVGQLST